MISAKTKQFIRNHLLRGCERLRLAGEDSMYRIPNDADMYDCMCVLNEMRSTGGLDDLDHIDISFGYESLRPDLSILTMRIKYTAISNGTHKTVGRIKKVSRDKGDL